MSENYSKAFCQSVEQIFINEEINMRVRRFTPGRWVCVGGEGDIEEG